MIAYSKYKSIVIETCYSSAFIRTNNNGAIDECTPTDAIFINKIISLWKIDADWKGNEGIKLPVKYSRTLFLSQLNMQNSEWNIWCGRGHYMKWNYSWRQTPEKASETRQFICLCDCCGFIDIWWLRWKLIRVYWILGLIRLIFSSKVRILIYFNSILINRMNAMLIWCR